MRLTKKGKITLLVLFVLLIALAVFLFISTRSPIYQSIKVEAGSKEVTVSQFLKEEETTGTLKTEITEDMLKTLGKHDIIIDVNGKEYTSTMIVEDTVAPNATVKNVTVYKDQNVTKEMFVENIQDQTNVTISLKNEISTKEIGKYDVEIVLEDEGKNTTSLKAVLEVKKDDVAPTISGTKDITVVKGKTVSYKSGVTVKDNVDENVELKIDSSLVNLNKVGKYKVTYSATDAANNTATKTIYVNVVNPANAPVTVEEVYAKADAVLAKIINNSMTKRQKCKKIYDWVHANMSYINDSDKSSWTKAAMYAFNNHKGDCYNYFAMTKALLTRAGIENIDLKATKHTHFWNFVKVEEGWYHLDTTPRVDHPNLFLRTDSWMDAYSVKHKNCFSYDPSSKPASATK